MPADVPDTVDPYTSSQQSSRRFIGLKLFLSLAVAGRSGYAEQLERDTELADVLRRQLTDSGWTITNDTPLPVVCFADPAADGLSDDESWEHHVALAQSVVESGSAWISTVRLDRRAALRACVISFRTSRADIHDLVRAVKRARSELIGTGTGPRR